MIVGKVTGSIVSTRKQDNLVGSKFMIVEPVAVKGGEPGGSLKGEDRKSVV